MMVLLHSLRVPALLIFLTDLFKLSKCVTLDLREYEELCDKITEEPNFSSDILLGKKWKPYYSWNLPMEHRCVDVIFKSAVPMASQHVPKAMQSMLKGMPEKSNHKQVLYMYMTPPASQTVLVADPSGIPGRFLQMGQLSRSQYFLRSDKKTRMLTKMAIKIIEDGQYVLMSDCGIGSTFLLVRQDKSDQEPMWLQIIAIAESLHTSLPLGHGSQACSFKS